jgi:nucleoside-diphosphate-sugar epimerase
MRVVVTGATGNVGTALVAALVADPKVDEVIGVARRRPQYGSDKVSWLAADLERDDLGFVAGADAVVNLAWKIQPQHDEAALLATNVVGTRRLLDAVLRQRVPAFVHASSVGTYGPGPKATVDERWPASGIPTSMYSRHKALVEEMLDGAAALHPDLRIVRMRTSLVFQRAAGDEVRRLFVGPLAPHRLPAAVRFVPSLRGLAFQATHARDVAEAYRLAVHSDADGAFNVAAEPVLTPRLMADAVGGRTLPLPVPLVRAAMAASWRLRLQRSEPGWLDMALRTPLMDTSRARQVLGWEPTVSAVDAFTELLGGMGEGAGTATSPLHPRGDGPLLPAGTGAGVERAPASR